MTHARTPTQPHPPAAIKMVMEAICMMVYLAVNPPSLFGNLCIYAKERVPSTETHFKRTA